MSTVYAPIGAITISTYEMEAHVSTRDVRKTTYTNAIAKQAHEADHEAERPINICRREASQRNRDRYEDKSPDPHPMKAIFWNPYPIALLLGPSHN